MMGELSRICSENYMNAIDLCFKGIIKLISLKTATIPIKRTVVPLDILISHKKNWTKMHRFMARRTFPEKIQHFLRIMPNAIQS